MESHPFVAAQSLQAGHRAKKNKKSYQRQQAFGSAFLWLLNIPLSLLINYTLCFSLVPTHWLCARRVVEGAIFERKKKTSSLPHPHSPAAQGTFCLFSKKKAFTALAHVTSLSVFFSSYVCI
jgi:hypothetical protein